MIYIFNYIIRVIIDLNKVLAVNYFKSFLLTTEFAIHFQFLSQTIFLIKSMVFPKNFLSIYSSPFYLEHTRIRRLIFYYS